MKPPKIPRASGVVRTGALALLIGLAGRARAESDTSLPPGFQWGSLFVAPSLATGLFVNSNPFNRSHDDLANSKNAGDIISILNPAVIATLPFRNSYFRTTYAGVFRNYQDPNTASNNAQDLQVDLNLRFASYDQLEFKADQERGAADTIRFDGGEAVYDGTPYTFGTYELDAQRQAPGHFGYRAMLRWSKLKFDKTDVSFFNYDGWEGALEAREAVSPTAWLVIGGAFRRFDHRLANDPEQLVYRQENTDGLQVGAQGLGAHNQLWRVILRYDRAIYPMGTGSDYKGLGGEASLQLAPGPRSTLSLSASRRTWSSFYLGSNYYLATWLDVHAQHTFGSQIALGCDLGVGPNDYPDAVPDPSSSQPIKRRDWVSRAEVYANFPFRSPLAFRLSFLHQGRTSNVAGGAYRADALGVTFIVGWR